MNIVHVGVGPISQSDVDLAQACGACIVGFNIRSPPSAISLAATHANIRVITLLSLLSFLGKMCPHPFISFKFIFFTHALIFLHILPLLYVFFNHLLSLSKGPFQKSSELNIC